MFPSQRAIRLAQVVAKRFLYCNPGRAAAVSAGRQCSVVLFSTAAIGQGKGYDPTPNDIRDNPIGNAPPSPDSPRLLKAKTSPHLSTYSQRQLQQTVQVSNNWIRTFATTNTILNKMGQSYKLLCLENPLLDIQAVGNQKLLDKYGLKANDAILASPEHLGIYDDLLQNYDAKLIAGGAAQNTARGAQYILQPNSVVYLGGVGDDKYAAILHDAVRAAGLRVEYRVDPKQPTGRCGVVITGHNRSMCTDLGAANHYDLDHLKKPEIWSLVENTETYYVGGYHFTVCPPAIMALAEEAATRNRPFILSLSAPFIPTAFKDHVDASSPYWDYVIGNESEVGAWAEAHGLEDRKHDLPFLAKKLANLPKKNAARKRIAIVTHGTDPTFVATQGEDEIKEFPVHAIENDLINDTNGAGDAFAGGFVAGVVEGKPLEQCIDMGQWLARLSIQELGPSYPFPKQTYMPSS